MLGRGSCFPLMAIDNVFYVYKYPDLNIYIVFTPVGDSAQDEPEAKLEEVKQYLKKHCKGKLLKNTPYCTLFYLNIYTFKLCSLHHKFLNTWNNWIGLWNTKSCQPLWRSWLPQIYQQNLLYTYILAFFVVLAQSTISSFYPVYPNFSLIIWCS